MSLSAFVALLLAVVAVSVPTPPQLKAQCATCSTSNAKLDLPSGQTNLTAPTADLSFVVLGVGFQNYTCATTGTYTSIGATADLFDLSCLSETSTDLFNNIQDIAYAVWSHSNFDFEAITQKAPFELGKHFFQTNAKGGLSPVWDFRGNSAPTQPDAFVVAAKVGDLPAPTNGKQNVDWLQVNRVSGALASTVYRTDTRGGQPPASCTSGSGDLQVKYVAKYWLFGSNITLSS